MGNDESGTGANHGASPWVSDQREMPVSGLPARRGHGNPLRVWMEGCNERSASKIAALKEREAPADEPPRKGPNVTWCRVRAGGGTERASCLRACFTADAVRCFRSTTDGCGRHCQGAMTTARRLTSRAPGEVPVPLPSARTRVRCAMIPWSLLVRWSTQWEAIPSVDGRQAGLPKGPQADDYLHVTTGKQARAAAMRCGRYSLSPRAISLIGAG
jgi:hypothetical protein